MDKSDIVFERYYEDVFRFLRGLSADEHLSEELAQETFYRALKSHDSYRGEADMRVWLCSIAKNLYYTQYQKQKRFAPEEDMEEYQAEDKNFLDIIADRETAEKKYRGKLGVDDSIFPEEITVDMNVLDYKMVYYNPWDPQYLSYLVVEYEDGAYAAELDRLEGCGLDAYAGFYGAQGFDPAYEVLAAEIDDRNYHGLVYALGAENNRIVYVEILFCNYFMDLEYEEYIDTAYLPVGFDAARGNSQRKEIMGEE